MTTLVIDNIGQLVTCDPALGEGPLGVLREAALVLEDDHVAAIERPARRPTRGSMPAGAV
jgi:imidazolonepropionase